MKIEIEEFEQSGARWIQINDGGHTANIVEAVNAYDFHLAKNAISNFTEMMNRYREKCNATA